MHHSTLILTFANIFQIRPYPLSVINQRPLCVQICAGPIRQRFVVQMEQLAIVLRPLRWPLVQERATEEFVFDFAGESAGRFAGHLELLVGVVVQISVLGYLISDGKPLLLVCVRYKSVLSLFAFVTE